MMNVASFLLGFALGGMTIILFVAGLCWWCDRKVAAEFLTDPEGVMSEIRADLEADARNLSREELFD